MRKHRAGDIISDSDGNPSMIVLAGWQWKLFQDAISEANLREDKPEMFNTNDEEPETDG